MKTENDLFQDVPKEQRPLMLAARAHSTETQKVKRPYTEDDKTQMKDFVTDESIKIMDQTAEFKVIQKDFNTAVKTAKETVIDALLNVKRGYSENEETVYLIDDQDAGVMNTHDADGMVIGTRKLFPSERQTTILQMQKTGTNN